MPSSAQPLAVLHRGVLPDHERDRITGEIEEPERDERDDRHDEGGLQDAAEDEGEHGRAKRVRASGSRPARADHARVAPCPSTRAGRMAPPGRPRARGTIGRPERLNHDGHEEHEEIQGLLQQNGKPRGPCGHAGFAEGASTTRPATP